MAALETEMSYLEDGSNISFMLAFADTLQLIIYAGLGLILLIGAALFFKQLGNSQPKSVSHNNHLARENPPPQELHQSDQRSEPQELDQQKPLWQKKDSLFSASEARFLLSLQEAIAGKQLIVAKVPLSQILQQSRTESPAALKPSAPQPPAPSPTQQILDFLLLNPSDFSPLLAIQLIPAQSNLEEQFQQQEFLQVCSQAKLPLLSIPSQNQHIAQALAEQIQAKLSTSLAQN